MPSGIFYNRHGMICPENTKRQVGLPLMQWQTLQASHHRGLAVQVVLSGFLVRVPDPDRVQGL